MNNSSSDANKAVQKNKSVNLWWIYLTYTTDFKNYDSMWLADNQREMNYQLPCEIADDKWIIFNVDQIGNIALY